MNNHTEIYKYTYNLCKFPAVEDLSTCPERVNAFRIKELKDNLSLTVIVCDNEEFNTIPKSTVESYVNIVQDALYHELALPEWIAPKPIGKTLAYKQSGCAVLVKLYEPLVHALAKKAFATLNKYFTYDDLLQTCYLTIIQLSREGYYCSRGIIERSYFNNLFMSLRKLPTRYVVLSFDEPTNDGESDDKTVKLIDTIADTDDKYETFLYDDELAYRRKVVISIIGQRQYDQIVREWRTNTTTGATQTLVNKLKRRLSK